LYRTDSTDILYVPRGSVPILTFNVLKLAVPKKRVLKLSCTESDLPCWYYFPYLPIVMNPVNSPCIQTVIQFATKI